jgi:hypothetical protein
MTDHGPNTEHCAVPLPERRRSVLALQARSEAQEWLDFFRESANPQTTAERWEYLDQAAVHIERLLATELLDG